MDVRVDGVSKGAKIANLLLDSRNFHKQTNIAELTVREEPCCWSRRETGKLSSRRAQRLQSTAGHHYIV